MKNKKKPYLSMEEEKDIPKNIITLVLAVAIIVSIMGTWMVMDSTTKLETRAAISAQPSPGREIALNIEYDNQTTETKNENNK